MFLADGGGGSGASMPPAYAGTQVLNIEPAAIPGALAAFTDAHHRVMQRVRMLEGIDVREWAGDPVSAETAERFVERTNSGAAESAVACLRGYERQLQAAIDSLRAAHDAYVMTEGTNSAMWGKHDS